VRRWSSGGEGRWRRLGLWWEVGGGWRRGWRSRGSGGAGRFGRLVRRRAWCSVVQSIEY
jgi:hypothetical protein